MRSHGPIAITQPLPQQHLVEATKKPSLGATAVTVGARMPGHICPKGAVRNSVAFGSVLTTNGDATMHMAEFLQNVTVLGSSSMGDHGTAQLRSAPILFMGARGQADYMGCTNKKALAGVASSAHAYILWHSV